MADDEAGDAGVEVVHGLASALLGVLLHLEALSCLELLADAVKMDLLEAESHGEVGGHDEARGSWDDVLLSRSLG